jgi:alpha-beta hydrolase superfamily lysophospholipase
MAVGTESRALREDRVSFKSKDGVSLVGMHHKVEDKRRASVVLAHGICSSKDYAGFQVGLANELGSAGFETLRFDFRGHGESGGRSEQMTIAAEVMDLTAAVQFLRRRGARQIAVEGHSFGGGIAVLYASVARVQPFALVLLAPWLDTKRCFLAPETPFAKQYFSPLALTKARTTGLLYIDDFPLGVGLIREFDFVNPMDHLRDLAIPALVVHGDIDSVAPYEAARDAARMAPCAKFVRIPGGEHYFEGFETKVFCKVTNWLSANIPS